MIEDDREFLLAVYGTLKMGYHNYHVKLSPREPISKGYYWINAKMYSNGRYPMLVKTESVNSIYLEIFQVPASILSNIDDLELPFGYHREEINLKEIGSLWIYYYSLGQPPIDFRYIESGNFIAEKEW